MDCFHKHPVEVHSPGHLSGLLTSPGYSWNTLFYRCTQY